jgi:hypothetical protein
MTVMTESAPLDTPGVVEIDEIEEDCDTPVVIELPDVVVETLESAPWVRPEAVARAKARLAREGGPTAEQIARSMVERLVSERVR